MSNSYKIFDRSLLPLRRRRAEAAGDDYAFLFKKSGENLKKRVEDVNRSFKKVFLHGSYFPENFFKKAPSSLEAGKEILPPDDEALPFAEKTFDAFLSNLRLHWVNDLPGVLTQIRMVLKPDGLFMASLFGGETLKELRQSLLLAETEIEKRASPRVSPFTDVRDGGNLLQRAGFAMPVADVETLTVSYEHPFALMRDLRHMGETNLLEDRRKTFTCRATMMRAAEIYLDRYGDGEGRIPATFDILYLTGWAPGPDQPKPLKPGSGKVDLKHVLGKGD